jgi:kynureninase
LEHGWLVCPAAEAGQPIAPLIGAGPDEVVATDSTSINLYKVLTAALNIAAQDAPSRKLVVSERSNFPTDLYIAEALCAKHAGCS